MSNLKRHKTVYEALKYVSEHGPSTDEPIQMPVWELVGRSLFDVAHAGNPNVRGTVARSTRAMKMITNRLVGRRRPGTVPAQATSDELQFEDMTQGEINV